MSDDDFDPSSFDVSLDPLEPLTDDPTGGLFFGPPPARSEDEPALGFAPDLDDDVPAGLDWTSAPSAPPARGEAVGEEARARRGPPRYPLAEAALARLLGEDLLAERPRPGDDGAAFTLGPAVMRPPPAIAVPAADLDLSPPEGASADETPTLRTDALMEDMVDIMLVGDYEDGKQHVHLAFKDDVFGGLYLKLERTAEGLFATFLVPSDRDRRGVEGHVDLLLARLRGRGMRISGHRVEVRRD